MEMNMEILTAILDAYAYEIVFVDRTHTVRFLNKAAKKRYGDVVKIGNSIFNCHNERAKVKIEQFLARADKGMTFIGNSKKSLCSHASAFPFVASRNPSLYPSIYPFNINLFFSIPSLTPIINISI